MRTSALNPMNASLASDLLILRENVIEMGTIEHTILVSSTGSPYCSKNSQEYPGSGCTLA